MDLEPAANVVGSKQQIDGSPCPERYIGATVTLPQYLLIAGRCVWFLVFVLILYLFLWGLSTYPDYLFAQNPSSESVKTALAQLGISHDSYAQFYILLVALSGTVFFLTSLLLILHRPGYMPVVLGSFLFLSLGARSAINPLTSTEGWGWLAYILGNFGWWFMPLLIYVLPNGRFMPTWTRFAVICWFAFLLLGQFGEALPFPFGPNTWPTWLPLIIAWIFWLIGPIARLRRWQVAPKLEQQQTKWVVFGIMVWVLAVAAERAIINLLLPILGADASLLSYARLFAAPLIEYTLFAFVPVTVLLSIFRLRLYTIDFIVQGTIVYTSLTAILLSIYAAIGSAAEDMFEKGFGTGSTLAAAFSTLVVVLAFAPTREGLKSVVEKLFNEVNDPHKKLRKLTEQLQEGIWSVNAEQVMVRLLDNIVLASNAQSGAAYLNKNGELRLVHTSGECPWNGVAEVTLPVQNNGARFGELRLAKRLDGLAHRAKDIRALQARVNSVAHALEASTDSDDR